MLVSSKLGPSRCLARGRWRGARRSALARESAARPEANATYFCYLNK